MCPFENILEEYISFPEEVQLVRESKEKRRDKVQERTISDEVA
jgi:hypothetical protein